MRRAGWIDVPARPHLWLANAHAPAVLVEGAAPGVADRENLVALDIELRDGRIAALAPRGTAPAGAVDLRGGLVWPGLVDVHTHLDKGHIWPRASNPDGSFMGALETVKRDRGAHWSAEDVRARMEFGLRCAHAQGTVAVRTHLDSQDGQAETTWAVFREVREAWAGRIDLQGASILSIEQLGDGYGERLADLVADSGGVLGCVARPEGAGEPTPAFEALLERVFRLAMSRGLDLDLHVDESGEQGARALASIARAAIRLGFEGRLQCGHCCSLAVQPDAVVRETIGLCRDAGLSVVSLPMCNLYLQDRAPGRTPRWCGIALVHELAAAGVPVSFASDNCRDPFYAYGDHDMLEVATQAIRLAHLDHPFGAWARAFAATPADAMGLPDRGRLHVGAAADLVLLSARSMNEMAARPQADRIVLRGGRPVDTSLPDYRELDALLGARP